MDSFFEGFFKENSDFIPSHDQMDLLKKLEPSVSFVSQSRWKQWLSSFSFKGVYLYGPPGGGKTVIMNHFFQSIFEKHKKIDHFHTFLFAFHQKKEQVKYRVLCLDEFIIDNIADAMILERFLRECAKNNVFIFLTSNTPPENLYKNGLQRDRFLSCIDFILKNFLVLELSPQEDFRTYESWKDKTGEIRMSYHDLCEKPFGIREYLWMAEKFETIEIHDFPILDLDHLDSLKRLMVCTDIFYLEKKRLKIIVKDLEQIKKMEHSLEGMPRMVSRLKSMMGKS